MEKTSVDAFGSTSQSLEELKRELGRLSSFTAELGSARDVAAASQQAANRVVTLVGQLGELQRSQLSELKSDNDAALDMLRQVLVHLTEAWGGRLQEEATKLLTALDTIVSRQHQLAAELAEFQNAMRQASRFAEALEVVRLQTVQNGEEVRRLAAGSDAGLQRIDANVSQHSTGIHEALQQGAANQSAAFKQIDFSAEHRGQQLKADWTGLVAKFSDLLVIVKEFGERAAQQGKQFENLLIENSNAQILALKQLGIDSGQTYEAQASVQSEALKLMKAARKESRIWSALTLLIVLGILMAVLLVRPR